MTRNSTIHPFPSPMAYLRRFADRRAYSRPTAAFSGPASTRNATRSALAIAVDIGSRLKCPSPSAIAHITARCMDRPESEMAQTGAGTRMRS